MSNHRCEVSPDTKRAVISAAARCPVFSAFWRAGRVFLSYFSRRRRPDVEVVDVEDQEFVRVDPCGLLHAEDECEENPCETDLFPPAPAPKFSRPRTHTRSPTSSRPSSRKIPTGISGSLGSAFSIFVLRSLSQPGERTKHGCRVWRALWKRRRADARDGRGMSIWW